MSVRPAEDENVVTEVTKSSSIKKSEINDDPFNLTFAEVRKLRGLSKAYVRRADRRVKSDTGFIGKDGAQSKQIEDEVFYGYGYLDCVTPPYNIDYLTKLTEISPAHHAAVNAKVESVFGLGWGWIESPLTKRKRDATRTEAGASRLDNHIEQVKEDMTDWVDSINSIDVWEEIMRKVGIDYETTGNAYIEIARTVSGKIGYMGHIPAKHMRIRRQRDGFIQMIGNRVVYFKNFGDTTPNSITDDQNPSEIIHLKKYSPDSLYYGVPDIIAAKNALAGNEFASRYNLDYFENKAVPRHVIIVKGASLSQNSTRKLIEFFESGLRGQHHRSVFIPLPKSSVDGVDPDIEFKSIEDQQQDFSFGDFRKANNEEIFMAHRIPMTRAGVFAKEIGIAASVDADKVFKESYSRPEQAIFEKKMARVFKELTDMVLFKLNELSLVDEDTQSQIDERNLRAGAVVPDEVRRNKGMGPRPDGKGMEPSMLNPAQKAEVTAQATGNRTRDQERQAASSQKSGDTGTRAPKGQGRKAP